MRKSLRKEKLFGSNYAKRLSSLCSLLSSSLGTVFSSWCLNELQKVMESRRDLGRTVLPVFYGIDPSDIRYQKAHHVAKAFEKHKRRFSDDKIKGWRTALTEVADFSGWDTKDRNEAEIVEGIAKFVWNELCDRLPPNVERFAGDIQSKVDRIMSLLKIGLDEKCFIGIWGIGGIGKTTLARVVYKIIQRKFKFDASCFLADVRKESEKVGFDSLQKKLLSCLGLGEPQIYNSYDGEDVMGTFLCDKKVLIVLDDVTDKSQLDKLAENKEWFGAGSKIIITTRDIQLLTQYDQFEKYEVERLNPDESLKLLCQKAFKKDKPEEGYLDLSKKIIKYACGLPLALKVLGSFLCKRTQNEWSETIEKWKKSLHKDIFSSLRLSYDGLEDEDYKTIFLDIACFFNGEKRFDVTNILKICGRYPITGIKVLIEKSLLSSPQSNSNSSQNGKDGQDMHDKLQKMRRDIFLPTFMYYKLLDEASHESLHMHDLLQEMGRNIVLQECSSDASERSRLWSKDDINHVLKRDMEAKQIESIVLVQNHLLDQNHHFEANWHPDCFSKKPKLILLDLSRIRLSRKLNSLPSALKFLRWDCYALESLPPIDQLNELESLQVCSSKIRELWDGKPYLYKLKIIDLSNSDDIKGTPNFSGTPNIEKLILNYCANLVCVHESVGQLKKLVELSLRYCTKLVTLPTCLDMDNLEVFILNECSELEKLPKFGESMRKLYFLDMRHTKITEIPPSIVHLINLKYLDLSSWHILKSIHELPPNLFIRASNYPFLQSTSDLQYLIASCVSKGPIHLFSDSKRFDLDGGKGIQRWFERQEHRCSKVDLGEVVTITAYIPDDVADNKGERWAIAVCIVFECLSEAWRGFSIDWKFQDDSHPNNESHGTDNISTNAYPLDNISTNAHPSSGKTVDDIPLLEVESRVYTGFYPIDKGNCRPHPSGEGSQVDLILCFPTTNTIDYVTIGSKKRYFRNLEIADCGWRLVCNKDLNASSIDFEEVGCCLNSDQLYELQSLQLQRSKIRNIWKEALFLDKLRIIDLDGCKYLTETPDFRGTPNLRILSLMRCPKLVRVHESVGQLKKLVKLNLESCKNLTSLPSSLEMNNLEEFILRRCPRLVMLPEFGENMRNIYFFDLEETSVNEIPSSIIYLINLKYFRLVSCRELKSIPKLPPNLIIYTRDCPLLETTDLPHVFASHVSKGPIHLVYDYISFKFLWKKGLSKWIEHWEHHQSRSRSGDVEVTIRADIPCDVAAYEGDCLVAVCILIRGTPQALKVFSINWKCQDDCHFNIGSESHGTQFTSDWRIYLGYYAIDKKDCRPHPSGVGSQIVLTISFPTVDSMGKRFEKLEIGDCGWRLIFKKDSGAWGASSPGDSSADIPLPTYTSDQLYELQSLRLLRSKIRHIWKGSPFLDKLSIIDLYDCEYLIETPDFRGTPNLKKLSLMKCPKLVWVHKSIGQLKKLVKLKFESCENLTTLPSYLETNNLEKFVLRRCSRLVVLPEFGQNMRNLYFFDLEETSINEIPSSIICLINLKYLPLVSCRKLKSIPKLPPNLIIYTRDCPLLETADLPHLFALHVSKDRPVHLVYDYLSFEFLWEEKGLSRWIEHWDGQSKSMSGKVEVTIRAEIPCDIEGDCLIAVCILFRGSPEALKGFSINWKCQDDCHFNIENENHGTQLTCDWRIYLGYYAIEKEDCRPHPSGEGSQIVLTVSFPTIDSTGKCFEKLEIGQCGWRLIFKKDSGAWSPSSTGDFDADKPIPSSSRSTSDAYRPSPSSTGDSHAYIPLPKFTSSSCGLNSAYLVATSGLLSSSWKLISDLYAENGSNGELFWKKVPYESDLTVLVFVTTQLHLQPNLLSSSDLRDNPFEFLYSNRNPTFALNHSTISLFDKYRSMLQQLKSQIDFRKPLIVTGHAVGGSIASLFTLWLLEEVGPREKLPLCITFGSPLIGDRNLQEAMSRSSRWNSCFLHVASLEDPFPSSITSTDLYRPFGTYLLCSDYGSACVESPDSILMLLKVKRPMNQGFKSGGYGYVVENLERNAIRKDFSASNITHHNLRQASLDLQLRALGFTELQEHGSPTMPIVDVNNLVKEMEREELLWIHSKMKRIIPNKKLPEMKIHMVQLEWYKKYCKNQKRGYYDSYKNKSDQDTVMDVKTLNTYWKDMVEEAAMQPQKESVAFVARWLCAGTSYRRMVEPLVIAEYYREGGKDYVNHGRSEHFKTLEKWLEDRKYPGSKSKWNVESLLTTDSCFWAHVEEALISCQQLKAEGSSVAEKKLEEFENYVYGLLSEYQVSPEIFLEGSSYMRWWKEYIGIMGNSHDSRLAIFMRNPANHEMYEKVLYDFPSLSH